MKGIKMGLIGRKKEYENGDLLAEAINEYFNSIRSTDKKKGKTKWDEVPTKGAMCTFLGISHETLRNYKNNKEDPSFLATIKEASDVILAAKEQSLVNGRGSTVGLIFDLKNNYSDIYKDKQQSMTDYEKKQVEIKERQLKQDNDRLSNTINMDDYILSLTKQNKEDDTKPKVSKDD